MAKVDLQKESAKITGTALVTITVSKPYIILFKQYLRVHISKERFIKAATGADYLLICFVITCMVLLQLYQLKSLQSSQSLQSHKTRTHAVAL